MDLEAAAVRAGAGFPETQKILVVDDSGAMRRIVVRTLREAGFSNAQILEAPDGAQALELARRELPDAVVTDWNMPVMDGLCLIRALRAANLGGLCGLVTSDVGGVRTEALAAGAQFVLAKPVTADGLRAALGGLCGTGAPSIPAAETISRMLGTLLGSEVAVEPGHKPVFAGTGLVLVALYEKQDGTARALVACDLELAACVASAMTGAPATAVGDAVRANQLSPEQFEAMREALNVGASFFGPAGASNVRLVSVHTQLRSLPPRAVVLAVRPTSQAIFTVSVPGFGTGGLCLCTA